MKLHLAAGAHDKVAAAILLHRLATFGAGLGIGSHPILRLAFIMALLFPLLPPASGATTQKNGESCIKSIQLTNLH